MREEWPKSCDVITFCVNRFWGFHSKLKVRFCYVPLKLSHSNFNLVISKPNRTYPNGKFDFENLWLNTLKLVAGHFKYC